ncbi:MAG: hypothetical protein AAHH96_04820 [Candidatus Symbiodolus clandestinus]
MVAALSQVNGLGEKVFHPDIKADFAKALAFNYQVTAQNPDGGWGHQVGGHCSDVISTAYAMTAITQLADISSQQQGWHYLIERQEQDGGFSSITDQVGSRPIPYAFPVLADIFALKAFAQRQMAAKQ